LPVVAVKFNIPRFTYVGAECSHCVAAPALRKSFHFMPLSVPAACAALALHSCIVSLYLRSSCCTLRFAHPRRACRNHLGPTASFTHLVVKLASAAPAAVASHDACASRSHLPMKIVSAALPDPCTMRQMR